MAPVLDWSPNFAEKPAMRPGILPHIIALPLAIGLVAAESGDRAYLAEMQEWRDAYQARLTQDDGWLSLAGLFWLKEGDNAFGTASSNAIVFPPGTGPETAGSFTFHNGETQLLVNSGVTVLMNGSPLHSRATIKPDSSGDPDHIALGHLSMIVIHRGERYGIRLWNNSSPARRGFGGVRWFPVKPSYRVTAQFTQYPEPRMIPVLNILGDTEPTPSPGFATFKFAGKQCRLEPVLENDRLFFMFKDATNGHETYPAGRFLYTSLPADGKVLLDFNQAHNPPCAFTPYATCPLPPKQNHLSIRIEAGELNYKHPSN